MYRLITASKLLLVFLCADSTRHTNNNIVDKSTICGHPVVSPSAGCSTDIFYMTKIIYDRRREETMLSQDEVRELLIKRIDNGVKQTYIAKQIDIPKQVLSAFKLGKKKLYPESLSKLEAYLLDSE